MPQYALNLSLPPVFSADNFFVSGCNESAHRWVAAWPDWQALLLHGPSGSGKTHLGHIWAARASAGTFETVPAPESLRGSALIENIERISDEKRLLHLLNIAREKNVSLLLTSRFAPRQLPFTLPDLTSRLLALPAAAIDAPDDNALYASLRKQLADRQWKVEDEVVAYLLARTERSFSKIAELVETLDRHALAEQRPLTIPFVRQAMGW